MFDFSQSIPRFDKVCADCGDSFKTAREDETRCTECFYYHKNPEQAPGYFTWKKVGQKWAAVAKCRDNDDPPVPGTVITVHRKDGSATTHTIVEVIDTRYDTAGNRLTFCRVAELLPKTS